MLRSVRSFGFMVALIGSMALAAPSFAMSKGEIRNVQEKLILLGYEPGGIDGVMGGKTRKAVKAFQKDAEIRADGIVGPKTLAMLDSFTSKGGAAGVSAANNQLDIYEDVLTDRLTSGAVQLPTRYGQVSVSRAGAGRYAISINGQTVATTSKGKGLPRFSRTFQLPSEDVILITSPMNKKDCKLEHLVLAVRADGSFTAPQPLGTCREMFGGVVENDRVVFPAPREKNPSWRLEDSWIYQSGHVEQK